MFLDERKRIVGHNVKESVISLLEITIATHFLHNCYWLNVYNFIILEEANEIITNDPVRTCLKDLWHTV